MRVQGAGHLPMASTRLRRVCESTGSRAQGVGHLTMASTRLQGQLSNDASFVCCACLVSQAESLGTSN